MLKRLVILIAGVLTITLAMAGVALAATPQDIYDDYADNGKLEGTYTEAELQGYLDDATVHQYGDPTVVHRLDDLVKNLLTRDEFPFTGFQLLMAAIVAIVLIGGGIALHHFTRPQKP